MRCDDMRETLLKEEGLRSAAVQDHLRTCQSCAAYLAEWERLRTGLRLVAEDPPPTPSFGFSRRVVRALEDPAITSQWLDWSLVRTGRRFVYAALTAALLLVLGVLIPASGPVRSSMTAAEVAQPEAMAAQNYPIFSGQLMDNDFEFAPAAGSQK